MATYQKRNGVYRAIVRRKGHPATSASFPTKSAARIWALRIEGELALVNATGVRPSDCKTVGDLITWHEREHQRARVMSSTQRGNLARIKESLGKKNAASLSTADILQHARGRLSGTHVNSQGSVMPPCAPPTMAGELSYLSEVYSLASALGKVAPGFNPVKNALPTLRLQGMTGKSRRRDRRPSAAEIDALLAHFRSRAWRSKIPMDDIVLFAIGTARREAEITRLQWSDIQEHDRTILVRDVKHPRIKTGNNKRFALLGTMWDLIQAQPRKGEMIFPYKSKSIGTAFTRACKDLRIDDLHFHDLRHEATSRLFEQGYSINQVATVTLHESWKDLQRYTQINPASLHRSEFA